MRIEEEAANRVDSIGSQLLAQVNQEEGNQVNES